MRRLSFTVRRVALFTPVLVFALIALLPLRLAVDWLDLRGYGFSARAATGSIWLGAFREARLGPVPLGDLGARLNTLPLLLGRARVSLQRSDGGEPFEGALTVSRDAFGVDDLSGRLSLGTALAPLPIPVVELDNVTARFGRGECLHAQGRVRASLGAAIGGLALPSGLSGEARCDGGMLLLPLAGQSGMEALDLRIGADGRYRATFRVRPSDDAARDRLVAAGFQLGEGGYLLAVDGTF